MSMKYELTNETIVVYGHTLYRIRALRDVNDHVKEGKLGGYVESMRNLSQDGECWIYDDAKVYGDAHVSGNAEVYGNARVYGDALLQRGAYSEGWIDETSIYERQLAAILKLLEN